jgi:hypothetical protein
MYNLVVGDIFVTDGGSVVAGTFLTTDDTVWEFDVEPGDDGSTGDGEDYLVKVLTPLPVQS